MIKYTLLTSISILLGVCSILFYQNDFIATENIGKINNETFLYSAYQTGLDNYRIEFKVVVNKDTTKLFNYYINDAVYTKKENTFRFKISNDTLTVFQSHYYTTEKIYCKTKKGTIIVLKSGYDKTPMIL